jgi:hypothetical protein
MKMKNLLHKGPDTVGDIRIILSLGNTVSITVLLELVPFALCLFIQTRDLFPFENAEGDLIQLGLLSDRKP